MEPSMGGHVTDQERLALAAGLARIYRGRVIPVIRGAEGDGDGAGDGDGGGAGSDGDDTGDGFKPVTTQAQFDRMVQDRIARERQKYADYDALKAKASKYDELEAENATELERAQKAAAEAQAALEKTEAEARETRLRAAIIAEAAKPDRKVVDPEAVVEALTGAKKTLVEIGDDGAPTNIAQAMDSLLEERPYLVASQGGGRGDADQGARGGGRNQVSREQLSTMTRAERLKAYEEGRLETLLAGE